MNFFNFWRKLQWGREWRTTWIAMIERKNIAVDSGSLYYCHWTLKKVPKEHTCTHIHTCTEYYECIQHVYVRARLYEPPYSAQIQYYTYNHLDSCELIWHVLYTDQFHCKITLDTLPNESSTDKFSMQKHKVSHVLSFFILFQENQLIWSKWIFF